MLTGLGVDGARRTPPRRARRLRRPGPPRRRVHDDGASWRASSSCSSRCGSGSRDGLPAFGTCAGMILLADRVADGVAGQETLGGLDITVRRNAFGRQVDSFEGDLDFAGLDDAGARRLHPGAVGGGGRRRASRCSPPCRAGAAAGRIVAVRQGPLMATSFHPEVGGDARIHRCSSTSSRQSSAAAAEVRGAHVRPLQMGDHQAQEGGHRRQARQDVRQADQEHRGRRPDGRR